ncbi:MAG: rubredoxin [Deltaproteobacteria bacterium]|nr:rubredoxin [Deltaproteobacteria bacterium]
MTDKDDGIWACIIAYCGYFYNPKIGDPTQGIPAGTRFEDLPKEWVCPTCGVGTECFHSVES